MSFATNEEVKEVIKNRKLNDLKQKIQQLIPSLTEELLGARQELRKINLEDVLDVLDKKGARIGVDGDGEFLDTTNFEGSNIYWILSRPIDDQPEETINFIYNLICEEK